MGTIKQLLQMHGQGLKYKVIARSLKMSKNTVKSYLRKVSESGVDIKDLLELDDPVLEMWFHAGTAAYPDKRFEDFKERLDYLVEELGRRHITKRLLWEEYRSDNPNGYMYSQFCFHLSQHLLARNPSMVLPTNRERSSLSTLQEIRSPTQTVIQVRSSGAKCL